MPGLQFHKLDLHTHTPASKCYRHKDHTAEQIVQAALEKGLSGIAVTDHNTAEWIDQMKLASNEAGLVVFPGVEISMSEGFHLVALFDPTVDQKHVESFLGFIDMKPETHGQQDAVCTIAVYDVIKKIHERGGLAILAHIDTYKGAFFIQAEKKDNGRTRVPINCSKLFNEANYDAVECVHGELPAGFDSEHQFRRFPAYYQSSDNPDPEKPTRHSLDGLGQLYSWFKLDEINLEGLRQCFADPTVRIRLMEEPESANYPKIVNLSVSDGGFLRNQTFHFHEGLNSIIGGKGVGKSLAVEFLRFGLDQPPDDPALRTDHNKKLAVRLEPDNSVEIVYQTTDGSRYQIERRLRAARRDGNLDTEEQCIDLATGEAYRGDFAIMFPVLAYSQTEVIKIAENKNAQLQLIDKLIDSSSFEQEIRTIQARLDENDQKLSHVIQARDRLTSVEKELDTVGAKIESISKSLEDSLFESIKIAERRKAQFDEAYQFLAKLLDHLQDWQTRMPTQPTAPSPEEYEAVPELERVYDLASTAAQKLREAIATQVESLKADKSQASEIIMSWMPSFDAIDQEYKRLLAEMGGDRQAQERSRRSLVQQKQELDKEASTLRADIDELEATLANRNQLLDELERVHRRYYDLRKAKYDELTFLSDKKLRVELEHAADVSAYEEQLVELLKGGTNALHTSDRRSIARSIPPRRLIQLALDRNATHLADEAEISELWAERAIEKLWAAEDFTKVLALQHSYFPTDLPTIKFQKQGGVYGELSELSVGQKCTALLIIALCDGTMPVIIDQPEDALDIASVWEDVAKKLRRGKNGRQFILTTHNSSVAVAADSDQFIILEAGATSGRIKASGAIDRAEVKSLVIDHLEGGPEPYGLRAQKYDIKH